ncbi:MAG: hypothetical protein ACLQIB_31520, partial [Isosphaeraceae bacterium]
APLADAMAAVLRADPSQLEAMGRAGAARVAERHDVRTEARKLLDLFDCVNAGPADSESRGTVQCAVMPIPPSSLVVSSQSVPCG